MSVQTELIWKQVGDAPPLWVHPHWDFPHGFSMRLGGVSTDCYKSLNSGYTVQDDPSSVRQNRQRVGRSWGVEDIPWWLDLVHGSDVCVVDEEPSKLLQGDALVTNKNGLTLSVTIADCCPVLIYDRSKKAVAAIHAGWRSVVQEIVPKTLVALAQYYETNPKDCEVAIGPAICGQCFEVGGEVIDACRRWLTSSDWVAVGSKFRLDLRRVLQHQLIASGVLESHIIRSSLCTREQSYHFFSHRGEEGKTGRLLAFIQVPSHF